jgi:preprotein translocase subunit SecG
MKNILLVLHMGISVALIALVILQAKGVGLGRAWGGGGEFYKSRRGVEKFIFQITVFMAVLFLASSVLNIVLS